MTNPYDNQQQQQVDPAVLQRAQMQYEDRKKNQTVMWLLWLFLGGIGGHRYYLGNTGYAIGMTLTLGGLGVWALIDAFLINKAYARKNDEIRQRVFAENGIANM
ncbi:TM2 domain-containing protein [Corynebacterium accolens]|uniref:TM2 domain-containing protein n=1 Tax=Corynebacterium accolens TaxID=38284 RepID=UPI0026706F4F|nr:TM2 domain-containing protein [Corynebacterium accolens]WKS68985.1 TM2 domain-containing protein [Corynebacterium accolens]WKS72149.1 TM2 domain-containing protein [Corynebacterium accolens]WKS74472.1 TM2 domain-containing protein [Corynebacterium accolens]